jgi:hypothetical protein
MMAKFRVTMKTTTVRTVEAENQFQAAIAASARHGGDVEVTQVTRAVGRAASMDGRKVVKKRSGAKKAGAKKASPRKRRQLSPQAKAKLAQNLVKARAARAAKRKQSVAKKRTPVKKRSKRIATKRAR